LAPIDRSIPDAIRQNITFLREDLLDEGKTKPQASLEAYRVAYQFCSSLIAALDEREKMLLKAGYRAVQANVITPATNQALEARRNYLMSWPQYEREVQQRNDLLRFGEAAGQRKVELTLQELKIEWANRATLLRTNLDALYIRLRAAMRESGVTTKTFESIPARSPAKVRPEMPVPSSSVSSNPVSPKSAVTNSLGMKFVPVPGAQVMMCIHETRNADYAAYAAEQSGVDTKWRDKANIGKENYPVVNVSWKDSDEVCRWLSAKEGKTYRLPSDAEWSLAVGLQNEKGRTPREKSLSGLKNIYPWGDYYPPNTKDGNYHEDLLDDGYEGIAPVMSFRANELGIHDMGGNVCEWCQDWLDDTQRARVRRGSSWKWNLYMQENLRSWSRGGVGPEGRDISCGFRCVLVEAGP
jgi:formylglycine-generating enzyme required for sulfatase activity